MEADLDNTEFRALHLHPVVNQPTNCFDTIGIGIGPFNLSVAALLAPVANRTSLFIERNESFCWHPGIMLPDSALTTSFLKDLVTLADPCSPYSFVSFLSQTKRLYSFINARFPTVKRREFEQYMAWVCGQLANLRFGCQVERVMRTGDEFTVSTSRELLRTSSLVVGSGQRPSVPACAKPLLGADVMHSSEFLKREVAIAGRRILVIGGGQSGAELVNHLLQVAPAQEPSRIVWASRRLNFLPIDDSPFVNEWFTPAYSDHFFQLSRSERRRYLPEQKLASDGIMSPLLSSIYQRLYELVHMDGRNNYCALMPGRELVAMQRTAAGIVASFSEAGRHDTVTADLIILATGNHYQLPECLEPLADHLVLEDGMPALNDDFSAKWRRPGAGRIYFQNTARATRGVADPNLSLASWRAGKIVNSIVGECIYSVEATSALMDWGGAEQREEILEKVN